MTDSTDRRPPGCRVPLIVLFTLVTLVVTSVSARPTAHTSKPKAAQALVQFLTSAHSRQILAEIGGFAPTRDSVYDRARGEYLVQVRRALQDAGPRPTNRNYTEFGRAFRNAVKSVVTAQDVISGDTARELAEIPRK
ncbi:hypothetical protein [Umezawaea sp. Da 62-37]|uniref:hypothetical protein n=1 Tax=Umezawaea sp. Da 62-37 TaxID=3075927 RepID=UPI0028F6C780|nr:hypothetical protein [Umezawaea sp. Da 62-37]WNV87501.1 hypothetical protein RM788_04130 [Umezawaea sp. Da 62-37]